MIKKQFIIKIILPGYKLLQYNDSTLVQASRQTRLLWRNGSYDQIRWSCIRRVMDYRSRVGEYQLVRLLFLIHFLFDRIKSIFFNFMLQQEKKLSHIPSLARTHLIFFKFCQIV